MRLASVLLASCAAALAATDSSADDKPPKPEAGKALRLALAKDKTYVYRLSEVITERHEVDTGGLGELSIDMRTEVVWDAGVSLQRVEEDGRVVVSLLPERVRGSFTEMVGKPSTFDSDDPKSPIQSQFVGLGIRVTLSPAGRVLDAASPPRTIRNVQVASGDESQIQFDTSTVKPFAQQFFHELPETAPRAGLAWEATRALALDWFDVTPLLFSRHFGDAAEKSTVTKLAADSVTAAFRARGERDVKPSAEPRVLGRETDEEIGTHPERLRDWLVLGEVRLRRDTGLVASRTWTTTIGTHTDAMRIPADKAPKDPDLPEGDLVVPAADRTREIASHLELVDVR